MDQIVSGVNNNTEKAGENYQEYQKSLEEMVNKYGDGNIIYH